MSTSGSTDGPSWTTTSEQRDGEPVEIAIDRAAPADLVTRYPDLAMLTHRLADGATFDDAYHREVLTSLQVHEGGHVVVVETSTDQRVYAACVEGHHALAAWFSDLERRFPDRRITAVYHPRRAAAFVERHRKIARW